MSLTSVTKIKSYLHKTDTTDDALLGSIVTWIDAWINNYCGRTLVSAVYTDEKYDGDNTNTLILKNYPITAVSSVKIDGVTLDSTAYNDPTNFQSGIYANQGVLKLIDIDVFDPGYQNVYVTYTAGYSTIPQDLELVATQMGSDLFNDTQNAQKGQTGSIQSERIGQYSVSYASLEQGKLPYMYKFILDQYKKKY